MLIGCFLGRGLGNWLLESLKVAGKARNDQADMTLHVAKSCFLPLLFLPIAASSAYIYE